MRAKLLLKLADKLAALPKKCFNICTLVDQDFEENKCGTQACALGWCPTFFPRSRLRYELSPAYDNPSKKEKVDVIYTDGKGQRYYSDSAAAKFFDIPEKHSLELFFHTADDDPNITPKEMAKKIRAYVKENMNKGLKYRTYGEDNDN